MTQIKLNEMRAALAAYQPQADAAGHGKSWATMCKKKTANATYAAADAADAYSADAAAHAAAAHAAAAHAVAAEYWAQIAIERINRVVQPAQRTFVGLTDEEIDYIYTGIKAVHHDVDSDVLCRAIEAKLKELNNV